MTEEEIQKEVSDFIPYLVDANSGDLDEGMVVRLCKEVERKTRHKIVSDLFAVANAVDKREDIRERLS